MAAYLEATHLAGFKQAEALKFFGQPAPLPEAIGALLTPWTADEAKQRFLSRFAMLAA
jgi:hypothetical protein